MLEDPGFSLPGHSLSEEVGSRSGTPLVLESWDQHCPGSPAPAARRGWGKQFLYLGVKEISRNICCGKGKHTWAHKSVRSPIQIGRQPVLILYALFKLTAASKSVMTLLMCSPFHLWCARTTAVVFANAGLLEDFRVGANINKISPYLFVLSWLMWLVLSTADWFSCVWFSLEGRSTDLEILGWCRNGTWTVIKNEEHFC